MYVVSLHKQCLFAKTGCTEMVVVYRFNQTALHKCTAQLEGSALDRMVTDSPAFRETTPTQALSRAGSAACYTQKGHREDPKHRNNIIW